MEQLYAQQIRSRSPQERLRLVKLVIDALAKDNLPENYTGKHSVLEFAGIGKSNRIGMDAQEYVNRLRAEWDHRP